MSVVVVLPLLPYALNWYIDLTALHMISNRDCLEARRFQCSLHTMHNRSVLKLASWTCGAHG